MSMTVNRGMAPRPVPGVNTIPIGQRPAPALPYGAQPGIVGIGGRPVIPPGPGVGQRLAQALAGARPSPSALNIRERERDAPPHHPHASSSSSPASAPPSGKAAPFVHPSRMGFVPGAPRSGPASPQASSSFGNPRNGYGSNSGNGFGQKAGNGYDRQGPPMGMGPRGAPPHTAYKSRDEPPMMDDGMKITRTRPWIKYKEAPKRSK